jgi:hypothetical protein
MLLGPRSGWLTILAVGIVASASCSDNADDAVPVPARPGLTQPEPGGALVDESEACERLTDAEEMRRQTLMCDALVHAPCPVYVRPLGSGCWTYSEDSLRACERVIADYTTCLDFDERTCVLSAVEANEGSCRPGAGGEGGGGSVPGTAGGGGEAR